MLVNSPSLFLFVELESSSRQQQTVPCLFCTVFFLLIFLWKLATICKLIVFQRKVLSDTSFLLQLQLATCNLNFLFYFFFPLFVEVEESS